MPTRTGNGRTPAGVAPASDPDASATSGESAAAPRPRSWAHREAQAYRRRRREYVTATNALVDAVRSRLEDVDEIEAFVSGRAKDVRSVEQSCAPATAGARVAMRTSATCPT